MVDVQVWFKDGDKYEDKFIPSFSTQKNINSKLDDLNSKLDDLNSIMVKFNNKIDKLTGKVDKLVQDEPCMYDKARLVSNDLYDRYCSII